jgi:hypothetical protein
MPGPGPGGPGSGPGPVSMQVSPRSPQAPPQQRSVLHRPHQGPPPGQGFPPGSAPPHGRGFDPRMGPPPGGMPPLGTSATTLSAVSRSDIFGLQGWTPGCKGPHLGILSIAVHHQDRDKCQCRVSLISRSHLWDPWDPWDQDMECLPHSNKGVESRNIDGDNRSRPGRDWKEHTQTRPLDPRLCDNPITWFVLLDSFGCDGPRPGGLLK